MSEPAVATKSGAPDPLIGRVIADRFKICSLIARGGMGKVYLAEQAPLGRLCAVKVLNANYTGEGDPEFHTRFFREARITSQITHPNSVTIFDYGKTDDDVYYMAMEYLEGRTLYQALREGGPMAEDRVGRIGAQICRAVREAHALDVIHRDLKPANIFLTNHGEVSGDGEFVKVLDFGLVKHLSERPEEQLTQTGLFMGSPKYMAPEQIQGGHVDARTDVYSLGIILYEMLAGKVPFERPTSVNILMAHVAEPPPAMREVNPNLVCSRQFEDLVMRCIAKDPAQRFRNMDEVLAGIRLAHGSSMTGQLGALSAAHAGALLGTAQRSALSAPRLPAGASASHTPGPLLRAMGSDPSLGFAKSRSRWGWIAVGMLVAGAVGGGLGLLAFRFTKGSRFGNPFARHGQADTNRVAPAASPPSAETTPQPDPTTAASHAVDGAPAAAPPTSAPHASAQHHLLVTSDPPGATVRDGETEVCAATPCELLVTDAAHGARTLVFSKKGYRAETRTPKATDAKVAVKLHRVQATSSGQSAAQAAGHAASPPSAKESAPQPAASPATAPSGFKDTPY